MVRPDLATWENPIKIVIVLYLELQTESEAYIKRIGSAHEYFKTAKYELQTLTQHQVTTHNVIFIQNFKLPRSGYPGLTIKTHPYMKAVIEKGL